MEYRQTKRVQEKVSVIGIGGVPFQTMSREEIQKVVHFGYENGINLLDIYMAGKEVRETLGNAIKGHREDWFIQGHIGTVEEMGQTVRTRDLATTKKSFEALLKALHTDYIDVGMFFYVDTEEDYNAVFQGGIIDYAQAMKKEGHIAHIGMGSHNAKTALKAVETDVLDVLMFSLNPAYDLAKADVDIFTLKDHEGFDSKGFRVEENRQRLYEACAEKGVAVTVMKSLGAGTLLSADSSPFKKALTVPQCIEYALTRPAVVAAILGCKTPAELGAALAYFETPAEERQFSHIFEGQDNILAEGRCMYCNHCQPCPEVIDVAAVTRFLHMAQGKQTISDTVRDHYHALPKKASDCIMCGDCEDNCPFHVDIRSNMEEALALFGE